MESLTVRQKECAIEIQEYTEQKGMCPTYRELAKSLKCSSTAAFRLCRSLERKGYLERVGKERRGMRLLVRLELKGQVSAGPLTWVPEEDREILDFAEWFRGECSTALVCDSSLVSQHIIPGDFLILAPDRHPIGLVRLISPPPEIRKLLQQH